MRHKNRQSWQSRRQRSDGSAGFVSWLRDRGSLTARLQARGEFAVRLLRQRLDVPTLDEARVLGIQAGRLAWIREVALYCDGKPVVFAHTVLAYRPRGPLTRWLSRLGTRSLGALLFAHPRFNRGALHSRRLDERHELFPAAIRAMQLEDSPPQTLWARRSRFRYQTQSVLVTEVFSPALLIRREEL